MEQFKRIIGFGRYEISDGGNVRNCKNKKIVKISDNGKGYMKVSLIGDDNKRRTCRVHRLVASHFIPNPTNAETVDHINENKKDNTVTNLRWCSHKENIDYWYENDQTRKGFHKEKVYKDRKELIEKTGIPIQVNEIKFISVRDAARYISVNTGKNINTIRRELRNMLSGKRGFGVMYGEYEIIPPS